MEVAVVLEYRWLEVNMLKYELGVAGAGLAEERRYRVWRGCVLEEEMNDTGYSGVVVLKMGIIVERLG